MFEGTAGYIFAGIGALLFFGLLIGGLAWMYGAQSAKRRRDVETARTPVDLKTKR